MTTDKNQQYRSPTGSPMLRAVPEGTKLSLTDGSIVEVVGNPGNGGWLLVRYLESPSGSPAVGDEEWVFYSDVKDFVE